MDIRNDKQRNYLSALSQFLKMTLLVLSILITMFILNQFNFSNSFPIKTVKVYGINRVSRNDLQQILSPLVNTGFFSINVEFIRDRLLQMPWIADLYVRRIWPDQVEITVLEKKAIAEWNNESLLSDAGELFSPKQETYPKGLPKLIGPAGKQIFMLGHFNNINRLLLPLHVKISYLELTPYFSWKLTLNNGMTMQLGYKDSLTRLSHFVKVYSKIVGTRATDVDYIDLRYPNGVAVRWKHPKVPV